MILAVAATVFLLTRPGKDQASSSRGAGRFQVSTAIGHGGYTYTLKCDTASRETWQSVAGDRQPPTHFNPPPGVAAGSVGKYSASVAIEARFLRFTITDTASGQSWISNDGVSWHPF
jgi:hypothetical protein